MTAGALWRAPLTVLKVPYTLVVGFVRMYVRAFKTIRVREVLHLWRYLLRVLRFGVVGFSVAIIAALLLAWFTGGIPIPGFTAFGVEVPSYNVAGLHWPKAVAFLVEGFIAVNLNFLGSRFFTWADRFKGPGFWKSIGLSISYAFLTIVHWLRWLGLAWLFRVLTGWPPDNLRARCAFWRNREQPGFWRTWAYFWTARSITYGVNQVVLNIQVYLLHLPTQLAYVAGLIVAAAFNYAANDMYVFRGVIVRRDGPVPVTNVCIVAPCKGNEAGEIDAFLRAIHNQTYAWKHHRRIQVILVGSPNDPAWQGIPSSFDNRDGTGQMPPNFALNVVEGEIAGKGRDSNWKRSTGARYAFEVTEGPQKSGEDKTRTLRRIGDTFHAVRAVLDPVDDQILVYADPDIQPPPHWLEQIVRRILVDGYEFVAGPVESVKDLPGRYGYWGRFWSRFIDRTATGSKTPRVDRETVLTMDNIGQYKPPVTANLAFTHRVWQVIGEPRPDFRNSYEDYEFCWRALKAGFKILFDPGLMVPRTHRIGLKKLIGEYTRSGRGFRDFAAEYPDSPFTVYRLVTFMLMPWALLAAGAAFTLFPLYATVLGCAMILSLILTNMLAARHIEGAVYPFIGALLTTRFVYGVSLDVGQRGFAPVVYPTVTVPARVRNYIPFKGLMPYGDGPVT